MKRILLLGANSAVAKACALQLDDCHCYCVGRSAQSLQQVAAELQQRYVGGEVLEVHQQTSIVEMLQRAQQCLQQFDLILFAYGYLGDQLASETDISEFNKIIEINFTSVVQYLTVLTPMLLQQNAIKIACITSVAGVRGRPRNFSYGAAKGALSIYLQGLRSVFYNTNIEIYDFKLGPVDSPMTVYHKKNFSFK